MIKATDWLELEETPAKGGGTASRRVAPESAHDLHIAVQFPSHKRSFFMDVPSTSWQYERPLPTFKFLETSVGTAGASTRVAVTLGHTSLTDVFTALVNDLVINICRFNNMEDGIEELYTRMERWKRLLEASHLGGLTLQERRGLYGELKVLEAILKATSPSVRSVTSWSGPLGAHHDFNLATGAIEVKTSVAKQPHDVEISSERQLDRSGLDKLLLVHLSVSESENGSGEALPNVITSVEALLDGATLDEFRDLLLMAGWLPGSETRYSTPLYSVRQVQAFEVKDGFPCITEDACPSGVGNVRYSLQLGALTQFEVPFSEQIDSLTGDK